MKPPTERLSDSDAKISEVKSLEPWLRQWREETDPAHGSTSTDLYTFYDQEALRLQRQYRRMVRAAAICGGVAVVIAIRQLALAAHGVKTDHWWVEGTLALLAGGVVIAGLVVSVAHKWLLTRFKAERIRHLKYESLSESIQRRKSPEAAFSRIRRKLNRIDQTSYKLAVRLMRKRLQAVQPVKPYAGPLDIAIINDLAKYANETYLKPQEDYFEWQAERREGWEWATYWFSPACFFLSVLCAVVHFGLEAYEFCKNGEYEPHLPLSFSDALLLFFAASLPVAGAVFRTIRAAHEFGRNAIRFKAVRAQLQKIRRSLADTSLEPVERLMWYQRAVWLLETEHLAWFRLMHEAEWFG